MNQDFHANVIKQKWCTDFTYLFLTDGSKRYNCTIIDLHDRSVIASITDKSITADLAKRTLEKAIHSQPGIELGKILLHSDQGSQYTSKEFTEFCEKLGIEQSMSKAGYPYDNGPMERYFNTLKNDLIYQHYYHTEDEFSTQQSKNLQMCNVFSSLSIPTTSQSHSQPLFHHNSQVKSDPESGQLSHNYLGCFSVVSFLFQRFL